MTHNPDEPVQPPVDDDSLPTPSRHGLGSGGLPGSGLGFTSSRTRFGRPVSRYQIPVEQTEPQPRSVNWKRIVTILVSVVVLGVAAGWVYVEFFRNTRPDEATIVANQSTAANQPRIAQPDAVVRQYLNALANGDVATAMSLGPRSDGDTSAISPEAYAKSLKTHPITNIKVPRQPNAATYVNASYKIGDQQVDSRFKVVRDDAGGWQLAQSTIHFHFNSPDAEQIPLQLNGVPISGRDAALLPGSYSVGTGLPYLNFGDDTNMLITNLEYEGVVQRSLTPTLTQQGAQVLMDAGRASLNACMAAGSLTPPGCPNQLRAASPYEPGTVRWSLLNDPFVNTSAALDVNDQTRGQASLLLSFEVSFRYTDNTTSGNQQPTPVNASFSASMLVSDPSQLIVTWTS